MYNGQKIYKRQAGHFFDSEKQITEAANFIRIHLLFYVLMMLSYMDIGGMKVHIGYIYYLKKFIMINVISN